MHLEDLDLGGDRVANEHGIAEVPVRFEKDRARPWKVHRHNRIQQAAGEAALYDQFAEPGGRRELGIIVEGVVIAGDLTVKPNVFRCKRRCSRRLLSDR